MEDAPIGENLGLLALLFRDASHHGGVTFPPERGDRDSGAKLRRVPVQGSAGPCNY